MTGSEDKKKEDREKLGKDIAFGIQQTAACFATDFIDPIVGQKIQKRFEDATHKAALKETFVGEVVGDTTAFFAFLGIQRYAPWVTESIKKATKAVFGGLLDSSGRRHLRLWAKKNQVSPDSERYHKKLEDWKDYEADNIAKTAVISTASVAANVVTQRATGSTHKYWVITMSKLAGAAITMAGTLGLRFMFPHTARRLDDKLSDKVFTPLVHKTQKLFGAAEVDNAAEPGHRHKHTHHKKMSHVESVTGREQIAEAPAR